jgi:hypothetical protein
VKGRASERRVTIGSSFQHELGATLSVKTVAQLESSLAAKLTALMREQILQKRGESSSEEAAFQLLAEPLDSGNLYVRARIFEAAPRLARVRVRFLVRCGVCVQDRTIVAIACIRTGRYAKRQRDVLSDQTERTYRTGYSIGKPN